MSKNLTWLKPSGEWGIEGVDLAALPPAVYGALAKLMRLEHPFRGPNPPLTLAELREMDGEPVWTKQLEESSLFSCGWALVTGFGTINPKHSLLFHDYGKTWLAYRRKPEDAI